MHSKALRKAHKKAQNALESTQKSTQAHAHRQHVSAGDANIGQHLPLSRVAKLPLPPLLLFFPAPIHPAAFLASPEKKRRMSRCTCIYTE
jgi:hypothetical protein